MSRDVISVNSCHQGLRPRWGHSVRAACEQFWVDMSSSRYNVSVAIFQGML